MYKQACDRDVANTFTFVCDSIVIHALKAITSHGNLRRVQQHPTKNTTSVNNARLEPRKETNRLRNINAVCLGEEKACFDRQEKPFGTGDFNSLKAA